MADMRQALNAAAPKGRRYTLTTALQTYRAFSPEQARQLCAAVDWINLMTYDMGGGYWGHAATHNAPLDGIKAILASKWSVFPPDKLCIGLAGCASGPDYADNDDFGGRPAPAPAPKHPHPAGTRP